MLIFDAERLTDVVNDVLVRRGIVSAQRFLAGEARVLEIHVHVAAGNGRRHAPVLVTALGHLGQASPDPRAPPVQVEGGRGRLYVFIQGPAHPVQAL